MASASSNATSMTVRIDGVDVLWPYDAVYDEQLDCMAALKACFDANAPGIVETPPGIGACACAVAMSVALGRPLVYACRALADMDACAAACRRLRAAGADFTLAVATRRRMAGGGGAADALDRLRLDVAGALRTPAPFDADAARARVAARRRGAAHEPGVYAPDGAGGLGFAAGAAAAADVVVVDARDVLDPAARPAAPPGAVCVFAGGHDVDDLCLRRLTVVLEAADLAAARRGCAALAGACDRAGDDALRADYDAQLAAGAPGSLRKARHCVRALRVFGLHLDRARRDDKSESAAAFLLDLRARAGLEARALAFLPARLAALAAAVGAPAPPELGKVAEFAGLVAGGGPGFAVVSDGDRVTLACLDASLAFAPVRGAFASVVLAGSAAPAAPLAAALLRLDGARLATVAARAARGARRVLPLVVVKGSDQLPLSTKADSRRDRATLRNYGDLVAGACARTPDGVVALFPTAGFLRFAVAVWDEIGVLRRALEHKLVFVADDDGPAGGAAAALEAYRAACDAGRGALLLASARGAAARHAPFAGHYGRCVAFVGLPFRPTADPVLRARLDYLLRDRQIREADYLAFDAMRTAAGLVRRGSKRDFGVVLLADARFARRDKRAHLPAWARAALDDGHLGLSSDAALDALGDFVRRASQPPDGDDDLARRRRGAAARPAPAAPMDVEAKPAVVKMETGA